MIYLDKYAYHDCEELPIERPSELCLNCGKDWGGHLGWACKDVSMINFSDLEKNESYVTCSMLKSINIDPDTWITQEPMPVTQVSLAIKVEVKEDQSESWRAWAHNNPGDCACGIRKTDCEFHR